MRFLGNGQYEIQNKKTGETKIVSEGELSQYGLSPQVEDQNAKDRIPGVVKAAIPTALGIAGGAVGSVGGPIGSLAAGGLGAMGGQAIINLLERALGGPTPQGVKENVQSLAGAARAQLAGQGIARGAGFLANPIRALSGTVTRGVEKSTETLPIDTLFRTFEKKISGE